MQMRNRAKIVFIYIVLAYFFALFFRFFLYFLALKHPEFQFGGHIISIWTADAGLHASIAKELLTHRGNIPHYISDTLLGNILYLLTKYTHLPLDSVVFTAPAFFASLIVVPIILIGYELGLLQVGFWSALAASVAMNYYFRTHLGYTDTDILNFPLFFTILYTYIVTIKRKNILFAAAGAVLILFFHLFYHSAKPLTFGLLLFYGIYILLFARKESVLFYAFLIYALPLLPIKPLYILLAIFAITPLLIVIAKRRVLRVQWLLLVVALLLPVSGYIAYKKGYLQRAITYIQKSKEYSFKDKSGEIISLQSTLKTVAEATGISWKQLVTYSSGSIIIFLLGTVGLLLLVWHRKEAFMLLLPYIIGIISLKAGVRFTTFAVPIIIIGFLYLFYFLMKKIQEKRFATLLFYGPAAFLVAFYLQIMDVYNHMLSPFFNAKQVQLISKHLNTKERGYILTWWDYGWPLWYYSNKRTIIDNGKHHYDNYIVAKTLFSNNQEFVARFDRFFIEEFDKRFPWPVIPYVAKRYGLHNILQGLQDGTWRVPSRKNAIYYYFDDKILTKLPVIEEFAFLSEEKKKGFVWIDRVRMIDMKKGVVQGERVSIDLRNGILQFGSQKDRIGKFYFSDGVKISNTFYYRPDEYVLILYKNKYIIGTYRYINSFFFQSFFFNNLDKKFFQTIAFTEDAKIFKLIGE